MVIFAEGAGLWPILGPIGGAIVTGVVTLLIWWLNKKRPNKINVKEVDKLSLLRIAGTIRQRIKATFDDKPVVALAQTVFEISNASTETIRGIDLVLSFSEKTTILERELTGISADSIIADAHHLKVSIPFLNPHCHHGELLTVKVVSDGNDHRINVYGRGEGWSAVYITISETMKKLRYRAFGYYIIALALVLLGIPLTSWLRAFYEVPSDQFSLPVFLWQVFIIIIIGGLSAIGSYRFGRAHGQLLRRQFPSA
jgi:hypothetical protein